jgi:endonuclease YncB( thermonuclease family)
MRLALVVITVGAMPARAGELTGVARVVDGDTLVIGATKIRLEGIDAPETDQVCLSATGARWACGVEARDHLAAYLVGREISCTSTHDDAYHRMLSKCKVMNEDLNGWMVQEGWALAYVKYSTSYIHAEEEARIHKRGLWEGAFIAPWDWRHRNDKTEILGAFSVPTNARSLLLPRSATAGAPSPDCVIKGNFTRNGDRIYHVPGQQFYARIRMDISGGRPWFCTSEEAEAAGWRKAAR